MSPAFQVLNTQDQNLNRVQANIQNALNQSQSGSVVSVNLNNFTLNSIPDILIIPVNSVYNSSSGINVSLPDATKLAGQFFKYKRTDTSTSNIVFYSSFKNRQGNQQTVENSSSYTDSTSLGHGTFGSDGNNWWLV